MSFQEIIKGLENAARLFDNMSKHQPQTEGPGTADILRAAADKLKTHQDNQPNEPLTLEELREMDRQPVWLDCHLEKGWGLIALDSEGMVVVQTQNASYWVYVHGKYNEVLGAKLYHRKPEDR